MAIRRFYTKQDSSIYSNQYLLNAGIDEILDISIYKTLAGSSEVARSLISFDKDVIDNFINNISTDYSVGIKLYLAGINELKNNIFVDCYPISMDWVEGTGRTSNNPQTTNGVSWKYDGYGNIFTGSQSIYDSEIGGGDWYNISSSYSMANVDKDLYFDVTNLYPSSSNGFILKQRDEFNGSYCELKYYSKDSHTIFQPFLEVKWDDSTYSSSLNYVDINKAYVSVDLHHEYDIESKHNIRINSRDLYPTRVFQTSSIYNNKKILPVTSYFSVIDYTTGQVVLDYDYDYTKISNDNDGNFFNFSFDTLYPNRYYIFKIKSIDNGNECIFKSNIFKTI